MKSSLSATASSWTPEEKSTMKTTGVVQTRSLDNAKASTLKVSSKKKYAKKDPSRVKKEDKKKRPRRSQKKTKKHVAQRSKGKKLKNTLKTPVCGVSPLPGGIYIDRAKKEPVKVQLPIFDTSSEGIIDREYVIDAALYTSPVHFTQSELASLDTAEIKAALDRQNRDQSRKPSNGKHSDKPVGKNKKCGWWKKLLEKNVDPISLEPLRELEYAPFSLYDTSYTVENDSASKNKKRIRRYSLTNPSPGENLFDGAELANFLVTTGHFINPLSRTVLTRKDCVRLDTYLANNSLKKRNVAQTFDIGIRLAATGGINITSGGTASSRRVQENNSDSLRQRQTAALISSMFTFDRPNEHSRNRNTTNPRSSATVEDNRNRNNNNGDAGLYNYNRTVQGEGGMTMVDDDDWQRDDRIVGASENPNRPQNFPDFPPMQSSTSKPSRTLTAMKPMSWSKVKSGVSNEGINNEKNIGNAGKAVTFFRRSEAAENSLGDRRRRKLKLLPRSSETVHKDSCDTSGSIFGTGRHRSDVLDDKGIEWRDTLEEKCMTAERDLCPYRSSIVRYAAQNRQWVYRLEARLTQFINTPSNVRLLDPPLEPMNKEKRVVVHTICEHWGLQTNSVDHGTARYIEISKGPGNAKPPVLLATAAVVFESVRKLITTMENNSGKSCLFQTRGLGSGILHISGLCGGGGGRVSNSQLHAILCGSKLGCRQSEYHLTWLDGEGRHVLIEFAQKIRARKVFAKMLDGQIDAGGRASHIRVSVVNFLVQWWGADSKWAIQQLSAQKSSYNETRSRIAGPSMLPMQQAKYNSNIDSNEKDLSKWGERSNSVAAIDVPKTGVIPVTKDDNPWNQLSSSEDDQLDVTISSEHSNEIISENSVTGLSSVNIMNEENDMEVIDNEVSWEDIYDKS